MEPIVFTDPQTGEADLFYVIEETTLAGTDYLLVAENENEDSDAYILKCISQDDPESVIYQMVEEEPELNAVARVFSELLDDDTVIE